MKKNKFKNTRAEKWLIVLLCAPSVLNLIVFWLGGQIQNMVMTFTDYDTGEVGLMNFEWALDALLSSTGGDIPLALKNTMIFFVVGLLRVPISVFFAYLVYRKVFGHSFMRLALYLPGAVCGIMMALLYEKFMSSEGAFMQWIQQLTNAEEPIYFILSHPMLYIIVYDTLVGVGGSLVIWLATISRIPYDLIEYGKLEGITPVQEFVKVVLPLIWPTFVTMLSLQVIGIFSASGNILVLTEGRYGTTSIAFWMYQLLLNGNIREYNHMSALGWIFTILTIPLIIIFRKVMNKWGEEVEY